MGNPAPERLKPIWILMKQEMTGWQLGALAGPYASHLHLATDCQITMPAPHHSIFYRPESPDALPDTQQTPFPPESSKQAVPQT